MGKSRAKVVKKRSRKSNVQLKVLEVEFFRNPEWSKSDISRISMMTKLSEGQVYKWAWDQKHKHQSLIYNKMKGAPTLYELFQDMQCEISEAPCDVPSQDSEFAVSGEVLGLLALDQDLISLQKQYKVALETSLY